MDNSAWGKRLQDKEELCCGKGLQSTVRCIEDNWVQPAVMSLGDLEDDVGDNL